MFQDGRASAPMGRPFLPPTAGRDGGGRTFAPNRPTAAAAGGSGGGVGPSTPPTVVPAVGPSQPKRPPERLAAASSVFATRRIVPSALVPPLLCLSVPPLFLLVRAVLGLLSGGYPTSTAVLALCIVSYVRDGIRKYAPDEDKRSEALERCGGGRLPVLATVFVGLVLRVAVAPLLASVPGWMPSSGLLGWSSSGQSSAGLDGMAYRLLSVGIRLAIGTSALSLAVVGRYLGWFSVVRCSSVPLQPNPIDAALSTLRSKLSSVDAILDMIAGPARPSPTMAAPHPNQGRTFTYAPPPPQYPSELDRRALTSTPRGRYQRPTLSMCTAQIVLHAIAGGIFASVAVLPFLDGSAGEAPTLLSVVCILSSIATVAVVVLSDGTSHELKYQTRSDFSASTWSAAGTVRSLAVRTAATMQRGGLVPYLVLLPLICHAVLLHRAAPSTIGGALGAMLLSYCAALFVSVYLVATDTLVRRAIAAPGLDVDRLLYYLPPPPSPAAAPERDAPFLPEDLIVQSVLWGCDGGGGTGCQGIVRDVVAPRLGRSGAAAAYGAGLDLEEEEVRRNDAAVEAVADAMVPLRPSSSAVPAAGDYGVGTLEEDVLRVAVLESLGGGHGVVGAATAPDAADDDEVLDEMQRSLGLTARHYLALRRRLLVSEEGSAASGGRQVQQPVVVPVVRALCAYAGGLGEALVRTSGIVEIAPAGGIYANRVGGQGTTFPPTAASRAMQWYLPPGATACAEYSILSAARLVALNFTLPTRGGGSGEAVKRRYSWLALLVPSVLHSAHRLRCGVFRYAQSRMERSAMIAPSQHQNTPTSQQPQQQQQRLQINDEALSNFIAVNCPDLRRVLMACDEAATLVMNALKELDGPRDAEVKVHSVCRAWLNSLLEKGQCSGRAC